MKYGTLETPSKDAIKMDQVNSKYAQMFINYFFNFDNEILPKETGLSKDKVNKYLRGYMRINLENRPYVKSG